MTDKKNPTPDEVENEKENVFLELQKVKLERFKVWGKIITVTVSVLFGSALGVIINWSYQKKQLDLKAMKHLGEFVDYALVKDSEKRFRFAEYFATLSPSETFKKNWISYRDLIDKKTEELIAKEKELEAAKHVVDFIKKHANEDFAKRLRVAQFFADFPADPIVKQKWIEYRDELNKLKVDMDEKEKVLAEAEKTGNTEQQELLKTGLALMRDQLNILPEKRVVELEKDVAKMVAQLSELPEEATDFMTEEKAERLLLNENWGPRNYTKNKFEEITTIKGDKVVKDNATGLMWEQSGSKETMQFSEAKAYVGKLNRDRFADNSDWRLPTLKEALTLLTKEKSDNGLYIGTEFDMTQRWIWTSDMYSASRAWVIPFDFGSCNSDDIGYGIYYVRAVR